MRKVWYNLRRLTLLLLATAWLQTVAHATVCHGDDTRCDCDSEATVCTCICHVACEPAPHVSFHVEQPNTVLIPSSDETIRSLLLPADIFRPPLANS